MQGKKARIVVIVPAYNEGTSIASVINEVKKKAPFVDLLVVNDGSEDDTAETAKKLGVAVVSLPFNLGIGGAVQTGLMISERLGYDVAVQVDGDGQHDPGFICQLVQPLLDGKADISIGSRYLSNENLNPSFIRHAGIRFFSWLTSRVVGHRISDCSSGFRALSRKAIEFFAEDYPVDFPDAEALVLAHRFGLKITEVPTKLRKRGSGKSSLRKWRLLYYPIKETFSIIMLLTKRRGVNNE